MSQSRRGVARFLPAGVVGAHLLAPVGLAVTTTIGRPRLFALSLYAVLALLVFDVVLLADRLEQRFGVPPGPTVAVDWRLTVALAATYLAIVGLFGRSLVAYGLFGTAALHGVVVVLHGEQDTAVSVLVVGVLSGALLTSQMVGIEYFASTADTMKHVAFARSVADAGDLGSLAASIYHDFPILHVLVASTASLTGLSAYWAGTVVVGVLFLAALGFVYLFVETVTGSETGALVAAIVVSTSPFFVEYALKMHAQSLSFVFATLFLFVLFADLSSGRGMLVVLLVVPPWVMTHHVSMLMVVTFTAPAALLAAWWHFTGREPSAGNPVARLSIRQYVVLLVSAGTYWTVLTTTVSLPLGWLLRFSPYAEDLPSENIYVEVYDSVAVLVGASVPFVVDTLHYAFWLAVVAVGGWCLLKKDRHPDVRLAPLVLPALVLYFPNPAWLPIRGLLAVNRWALLALPFVAVPVALAVERASALGRSDRPSTVFVVVVGLLVVSSVATGMSDPTLTTAVGYQKEARDHLSAQQIEAVEFVRARSTDPAGLPATMYHYAAFSSYGSDPETALTGGTHRIARISGVPGAVVFEPGLTVVPATALAESAVRMEVVPTDSDFYGDDAPVLVVSVSAETVTANATTENVVYSSRAVRIIYR